MIRTVISLSDKDKHWLDKKASHEHITMTEVVRRAIHHYQKCEQFYAEASIEKLLIETRGIWEKGDALEYQKSIRDEWENEHE